MNSRERILNSFAGKKVDRIPVSPFIWVNYVNEFFGQNWTVGDEIVDSKLHEIYRHFDLDSMVRSCSVDLISPAAATSEAWQVSAQETRNNERQRTVITTITTPERELREVKKFEQVNPYTEINAATECFVKDQEDFAQFVKYQPPVPQADCSRITRAKAMVGDEGVVAPWLPSIFNTLSRLRKLDDLICDAVEDPDFFQSMMAYYRGRTAQAAAQLAKVADIVTYEGNIANGSIAGPVFFQEYLFDDEKAVIDTIKENGAYVLFHNCGDCNNMFEIYSRLGLDALETLTPPPFGNADVNNAIRTLNPGMTLLGNIDQIEFLVKASPEEVRERARELIAVMKKRGNFILATSDYIENGTPEENVRALVRAARDYGAYE